MGFGPFSSESTSSDQRQSSGDAGINVKGNSKISSPGSSLTDLSGAKVTTAPQITGNKGNVTINEAAGLTDLASSFTDAIKAVAGAQAGAQVSAIPLLNPAPSAADNSTTATPAAMPNTTLWLWLGGGLAVLAVLFILLKKNR